MIRKNQIHSRGMFLDGNFFVKVYPFTNAMSTAYEGTRDALGEVALAIRRNKEVLTSPNSGREYKYGIAFPRATETNARHVDLYCFDFDRIFEECNPEWDPYIFVNGELQQKCSKGCGTGLIILGMEEDLRRDLVARGQGIDDYRNSWVNLGYLGPTIEDTVRIDLNKT